MKHLARCIILLPLLLIGCITTPPHPLPAESTLPDDGNAPTAVLEALPDFPAPDPSTGYTKTLYAEAVVQVEPEPEPTAHERWLWGKETWDEAQRLLAELMPGYTPEPYGVPDPDAPPEPTAHELWLERKASWDEAQSMMCLLVPDHVPQDFPERDPDLPEEPEKLPDPEPEPVPAAADAHVNGIQLEGPLEAFTGADRQKTVDMAGTQVPDWFVYICTVLILATLIALCYIAKQRKERHWYQRHSRE